MPIDNAFLDARIARTKTLILAYEDASDALATGAQSYSIDTGQTRQTVTKPQLSQMKTMLLELENRLSTLCQRRDGRGLYGRPGF